MGRWEVLEEVALADCALEISGDSLDDCFETATLALAEIMVDPTTLAPEVERTVSLSADRLDLLLFDWLSELIYVKDRERLIFTRAEVRVTEGDPARLEARLAGGVIDPGRTVLRADPKAVTFHQFAIERVAGGWRARVVIDI